MHMVREIILVGLTCVCQEKGQFSFADQVKRGESGCGLQCFNRGAFIAVRAMNAGAN